MSNGFGAAIAKVRQSLILTLHHSGPSLWQPFTMAGRHRRMKALLLKHQNMIPALQTSVEMDPKFYARVIYTLDRLARYVSFRYSQDNANQ